MLPLDIYYAHLKVLNGISFTPREIDIIACILNGRSAKTIPALLSIAPKTVAAHMENIRSKAGCSSRESIIDFVEISEHCFLLKNEYYQSLLTQISFEKCLGELRKIVSLTGPVCSLVYEQENNIKISSIHYLKQHLSMAGFKLRSKIQKGHKPLNPPAGRITQQETCILHVLPNTEHPLETNSKTAEKDTFTQKIPPSVNRKIVLVLSKEEDVKEIKTLDKMQRVDFSEQKNYYCSVIELLHIICPDKSLGKIFKDFKQQVPLHSLVSNNSEIFSSFGRGLASSEGLIKKIFRYLLPFFLKRNLAYFSLGMIFFLGIFFCYNMMIPEKKFTEETNSKNIKENFAIRSDLIIPTASSFLNRSELISQIDSKLKGTEDIQSLALIGIGGAGKTTLARQYAQQQNANVVWEINAETRGDLNTSFERLGAALSKTEREKGELRAIHHIKNLQEREEKLILFVRTRLRATSNWFLIFDNVETLAEIHKYFPHDSHVWGSGKIILTSRDHHLQNNNQINQVLFVGELNQTEKLSLFSKIMRPGAIEPYTSAQEAEANQFLNNIPPFPLDISVAAYYLKSAGSSYSEYIESIKKYKENFENFQNKILKENGGYSKTRHGIITLSLEKIIEKSKDFSDLFLFISLLNSQEIPRDLLEKYKDPIIVGNFIYHLKKYSLIMNTSFSPSTALPTLSLHHSTQDISLSYLVKHLNLNKKSPLLNAISNTLDDYMDQVIEQEDFQKMKKMTRHLETFLNYSSLLTNLSQAFLKGKLGSIYYFIKDDNCRQTIENSFGILKKQNLNQLLPEDTTRLASSLVHIGAIYTELRLYQQAEDVLEKAMGIYEIKGLKNYLNLSWALTHLGNNYRRIGHYEKAKDYLEKGLNLNKQYGGDKKRTARNLAFLGSVYKALGLYQKSRDVLEESLALHKDHYSNDHYRVGWVLLRLGNMYRRLGDYEKSLNYLYQSLNIHQKHFDESHVRIGWVLFHIAGTYKSMGNYGDALKLCDKILEIYAKHCGKEDIESARLLRNMAKIYLEKDNLDHAENLAQQSLKILQKHNHVDAFRSFEILGEIYLRKSVSFQVKSSQERKTLTSQAIEQFNQALKIVEQNFPKTSVHLEKIVSSIKKLQGENH